MVVALHVEIFQYVLAKHKTVAYCSGRYLFVRRHVIECLYFYVASVGHVVFCFVGSDNGSVLGR